MDASCPNSRIRFGKFEVNLRTGELRKQGHRIRIQPQPVKILALLLERPGELVTRDELRNRLWPGELYVDFELGLNRSINKLRRALLDDASSPIYIETLSTRGYRFIAPVQADSLSPEFAPETPPHKSFEAPHPPVSERKRRLLLSTGALILLCLLLIGVWRPFHNPALATPTDPSFRPVPLVTFANGSQWHPAFSPDGARIAYSWQAADGWYLEVKDVGTDTHLRITQHPADFPPGPAWSPDGRQIAFARAGDSAEDRGIFVISSIGGPEKKLHSLALWHVPQRIVTWSPDGRWIAFADEVHGDASIPTDRRPPNAIYLISPLTLETHQLTYPPSGDFGDAAPTFSPDGSTIAFIRTKADSHDEIYTIPAQGGTPRRLVTEGLWTNGLAWTADGKSIVFDRSLAGGFRLWRVSATGDNSRPLDIPSKGQTFLEPTLWRNRLAFEAHELSLTIAQIPMHRSRPAMPSTPVASTRTEQAGRYSPDGKHIAFLSDRTGADELWMSRSDGTNAVQLTHFGVPLVDLCWHPGGNLIAISTFSGKVYAVSPETQTPQLVYVGLPFTDEHAQNIAFSRNGDSLYVLSQPGIGDSYDLLKMPSTGGTPQKILSGRLSKFSESFDGKMLFYSRADGLWTRPVEGGAEKFLAPASSLWDVNHDGIYILSDSSSIERYSLDGKRLGTAARLGHFAVIPPMSISPDTRSVLFGYEKRRKVEIDMVDGFD